MLCTTGSTEVMCCGKHGGVCVATAARQELTRRRSRPSNNEAWESFWRRSKRRCVQVAVVLHRWSGDTYRKQTGSSGRWGYRRYGIEWCRWRRSWWSSRSSRRTSSRAVMDSGRRRARPKPWKRSGKQATGDWTLLSMPTFRATSTAFSERTWWICWRSASRTGGCWSWSANGWKPEWWRMAR